MTGTCRTVNGSIKIGENSQVKRLQTVNGSIKVGESTKVGSDIETVNGRIECAKDVYVRGSVQTVSGSIELSRTTVHRDITTHNGHITLEDYSVVERDIIVKNNKGKSRRRKPLTITIADGSVVEGDIIVKDDDIKVMVHLKDGGKVIGRVIGAKVARE